MSGASEPVTTRSFVTRTLLVVGVLALAFVAWRIRIALLLAFGGVLFAILFSGLASLVSGWTGASRRWSLVIVLVTLVALIGGGGFLLEKQIVPQFSQLSQRVSAGMQQIPFDLQGLFDNMRSLISPATRWAATLVEGLGYFLLVIFIGIYVSAAPKTYRKGILLLLPARHQERGRQVLDVSGRALWRWLLGTLASMAAVGILTAAGLFALGIPAALALAVIAGLLEFIPIVGPWLSAIPALLVAVATGGWTQAAYVALLYFAIQQLEGNVIYPLVQREAVSLPPALTALAIVAFGLLFGFLGLFLATPLLVTALVMINMLYVEDVLGRRPRFLDH